MFTEGNFRDLMAARRRYAVLGETICSLRRELLSQTRHADPSIGV